MKTDINMNCVTNLCTSACSEKWENYAYYKLGKQKKKKIKLSHFEILSTKKDSIFCMMDLMIKKTKKSSTKMKVFSLA